MTPFLHWSPHGFLFMHSRDFISLFSLVFLADVGGDVVCVSFFF